MPKKEPRKKRNSLQACDITAALAIAIRCVRSLRRKLKIRRSFAVKSFHLIVFAVISMHTTVLYGDGHLNSNNISYQFPLKIRAVYNIEKQWNQEGISSDKIAILVSAK